jgi:hypothetical protein
MPGLASSCAENAETELNAETAESAEFSGILSVLRALGV